VGSDGTASRPLAIDRQPWLHPTRLLPVALLLLTWGSLGGAEAAGIALSSASANLELEAAIPHHAAQGLTTELRLRPELQFDLPANMRLTAIGRARVDLFDHLEPGTPDQASTDPIARRQLIGNRADLELREFYVEANPGNVYLRMGKQQIVWGTADGLKVLDVINPQSFREFVLPEFEDSRIPLWTLNAETRFGDHNLQFVFIPEQTYHEIPAPDAAFAITAPRFTPPIPAGMPVQLRSPNRPSSPLADADTGLRLTTFLGGWDLSLLYFHHYEDIPVPRRELTTTGLVVTPEYDRVDLVGGSFAKAFGPLTLRGELGYTFGRAYALRDPSDPDGLAESDAVGSVVGLDWAAPGNWFVSGQVFVDRVIDPPGPLYRPRTDTTGTLYLRRLYHNDRLALELRWLANANDGDGLIRPRISYDLNDQVTLWGGVDFFHGDHQGTFGQFDDRDRAVFGIRYGF